MTITKSKKLKINHFSYIKAFFNLMKPRVMSLVIFTCAVGLLIAPAKINFINAAFSILAVALGSGAAGALNMWYESDLDSVMSRTCLRATKYIIFIKIQGYAITKCQHIDGLRSTWNR